MKVDRLIILLLLSSSNLMGQEMGENNNISNGDVHYETLRRVKMKRPCNIFPSNSEPA